MTSAEAARFHHDKDDKAKRLKKGWGEKVRLEDGNNAAAESLRKELGIEGNKEAQKELEEIRTDREAGKVIMPWMPPLQRRRRRAGPPQQ